MKDPKLQDLEARHQLGRKEYWRRLEQVQTVCDDIRATRVALARIWLAEHYPDEDITITESASSLENISMGFHLDHRYAVRRVGTEQISRELIAYFNTIGGFNCFPE